MSLHSTEHEQSTDEEKYKNLLVPAVGLEKSNVVSARQTARIHQSSERVTKLWDCQSKASQPPSIKEDKKRMNGKNAPNQLREDQVLPIRQMRRHGQPNSHSQKKADALLSTYPGIVGSQVDSNHIQSARYLNIR